MGRPRSCLRKLLLFLSLLLPTFPSLPLLLPCPACLLQDEQRLELLKEIGGTRVYEDRRRESFRVLEECLSKRTHIQDLVGGVGQVQRGVGWGQCGLKQAHIQDLVDVRVGRGGWAGCAPASCFLPASCPQ